MELPYKMKQTIIPIIAATVLVFILPSIIAIPTPHSIKGNVYDLDGVTPITKDTWFNITNNETKQTVTGKVGQGPFPERFSVSVPGVNGDRIDILFWNKYHQAKSNLTLSGVIDNLIIIINDSFPNNPPEIISTPDKFAHVGTVYNYDVDAIDPEGTDINYELLVWAPGMIIHSGSGLIQWIPLDRHVGKHGVVVQATDGDGLNSNQSFYVWVNKKKVKNATTPTSRHLIFGSIDSDFEEDLDDTVVNVNDGINSNSIIGFSFLGSTYYIGLIDLSSKQSLMVSGNKDGLNGNSQINSNSRILFEDISLNSYTDEYKPYLVYDTLKYFHSKPLRINKIPENQVLAYAIANTFEEKINFVIKKEWIKQYGIGESDVLLEAYTGEGYQKLTTNYIGETEKYIIVEALVDCGCTSFAITVEDAKLIESRKNERTVDEGAGNSFVIDGIIYDYYGNEAEKDTLIRITNTNNGKTFNTRTGTPINTGGFSVIVNGKRQDIMKFEVILVEQKLYDGEFNLQSDMYIEVRP